MSLWYLMIFFLKSNLDSKFDNFRVLLPQDYRKHK